MGTAMWAYYNYQTGTEKFLQKEKTLFLFQLSRG